ncbi:MAG: heavy-metal-associated domain-containing protein [Deltaproteobacteria bacterium]|nr:heavy-metal-associated domain-containing protein [Deltaproteobacteria bacterium]
MGLYSFIPLVLIGAATLLACPCCNGSKAQVSTAFATEPSTKKEGIFERDYFVKGMTCGGCVFGVKKALNRAGIENSQIIDVDYKKPDPDKKIGHAKVRFSKGSHKGLETDCKIAREIKNNPGYIAYWDQANPDPCGLEKKN